MQQLRAQMMEGFTLYGCKEATEGKIARMKEKVELYTMQGCYNAPAPDFDLIDLTEEDDIESGGEGDVEVDVWNADEDGDVNNEMDDDEEEEEEEGMT